MTDINANIISKNLEKVIANALLSRSNVEKIRRATIPIVSEQINKAVENTKKAFNPAVFGGDELVGQLGIGKGGSPDTDKINNVYKEMQIGVNPSVTKLRTTFQAKNLKRFGKIKYEIDKRELFNSKAATYISTRSKDGDGEVIKWLENFIYGLENRDFEYIDKTHPKFRPEYSRTGTGQMIVAIGSHFKFSGAGEIKTFQLLEKNIKKSLSSSSFKAKISRAIANVLRG